MKNDEKMETNTSLELIPDDYKLMLNLIDVASRRGVYGADDLLVIGFLVQKLKNHIETIS